ncbi:maleylpyruvate isomerase N-terminal domain-containing protein [Streptomyces kronopolitis]|uniref:maleylpyruvate isomerase N-terminal domain-containing protein n=1 Tax=Streptomyces kronopolitis TaxID=1612435 RepID=UPI00343D17C1
MTQTPAFEDLLSLVQDRSAALRSSIAGSPDLGVRVPSCPGWSLRDLVEHVTEVHRFWAAAVAAGPSERPPTVAPADDTLSADILARSAAATEELIAALRGGAPAAGAWAQIPLPAPGVFRIRPLAFEATASYLQRLAGAYRLTLPQLLDSAGITVHGHGTPPAAELDISPTAARRVAAVARVRPHALARALPGLLQDGTTDARPATAYWSPVERRQQAVRACTRCVRHHSRGTADTAWIHRPWHQLVCRRHQQAPPTHDSRPHCAPGPFPNSPRPTTATSGCNGIHGARMHGRQHTRSPPDGTTTNNTSPTTCTGACINSREPTRTWTA